MSKLSLRVSAIAFGVLAAACADSSIVPTESLRSAGEALKSSSPSVPFEIDVASIELRPGGTRQITTTKSANGKVVPEPSVDWTSANAAVATVTAAGLVTAVAPGQTTVTVTRGAHHIDVPVAVVDPCTAQLMGLGVTTGEITPDDCPFTVNDRRSDYYWFPTTMGEVIKIQSSGLVGLTGIKENTADPKIGTVFGSRAIGAQYRVISNGDPVQFFVSGLDGTKFGAYSATRGQDTQAHVCGLFTYVMRGATFSTNLTSTNSCHATVQFTPVPQALGKPLFVQDYLVKMDAGTSYTITLSGLTNTFDPALTVYSTLGGFPVVAQSVPGPLPAASTRSVTFTPSATTYYDVEVASGRFIDAFVTWQTQTGPFTMSVSR